MEANFNMVGSYDLVRTVYSQRKTLSCSSSIIPALPLRTIAPCEART